MNERHLAVILQNLSESLTDDDLQRFYFTREQQKQLNEAMRGQNLKIVHLPYWIARVAVALAILQGLEGGQVPDTCWSKAMAGFPISNTN